MHSQIDILHCIRTLLYGDLLKLEEIYGNLRYPHLKPYSTKLGGNTYQYKTWQEHTSPRTHPPRAHNQSSSSIYKFLHI